MQDLVPLEVERQHLAWAKAALFDDPIVVELDRTDLRTSHDQALGGDLVATRPQAIAVQSGADEAAIREGQRRRSVPRLDDRRVVVVEGLDLRRQPDIAFPGAGHEHAQCVQHVATVALEHVQRLVEAGRVRALLPDDRTNFGRQAGLTRPHPGAIAEQGVDLAVVGQQAERLGELPGREGVGRVALVEDGQAAFVRRVAQVEIEGW